MTELTVTTTTTTTTLEGVDLTREVTRALSVILARVRCALIHEQTSGGRCADCISWAENVGTPEHAPRLLSVFSKEPTDV